MKKHVLLVVLMLLPLMASAQVKRTINVETAGTLPTLISDDEKYTIEELTLTGELNGTDFRLLRDMAGCNYLGNETNGGLKVLDISDIRLAVGGDNFVETDHLPDMNGHFSYSVSNNNELPQCLFAGCKLQSLLLPTSITEIGTFAFLNCYHLLSVNIPEGVSSIGQFAFDGCKSLPSLAFPSSLNSISPDALFRCSSLQNYVVDTNNMYYCSSSGVLFNKDKTELLAYPIGRIDTEFTIPEGVISIGMGAFAYCPYLVEVKIPNTITTIDGCAFWNCINLSNLVIPNSVTTIGHMAFDNCRKLSSVIIPNSVTTIRSSAFEHCLGLKSIDIPSSVTLIENSVFRVSSNLTEINVDPDNQNYCSVSGVLFDKDMKTLICFPAGSSITEYVIPDGIKNLEYSAFYACQKLTSISLPNSLSDIGVYAFEACQHLEKVYSYIEEPFELNEYSFCTDAFNNAVLYVPMGRKAKYQARANWTKFAKIEELPASYKGLYFRLKDNEAEIVAGQVKYADDIVVPKNVEYQGVSYPVTSIGEEAFSWCSGLTSVTIPNSVTSIGQHPFRACSGLTSIEVEGGNTKYDSRNNCNAIIETQSNTLISGCKNTIIPNGVTSIGDNAFYGCGLTSVTIPNSVTSIGIYAFWGCGLLSITIPNSVTSIGAMAFKYCNELTSVTIPNSVTSISNDLFSGCSKLTSVTIPNSVTSIGTCAFDGCISLKDVYCYAKNVPETRASAFTYCNFDNMSLHVPAGSVEAYKSTEPWNQFKEIKAIEDPNEFSLNFMGQIINDGATLYINAEGWSALGNIYTDPDGNTKNGLFVFVNKGGKVSGSYSLEILSNTLNGDLKWSMGGETYALNEVSKLEKSFSTDDNGIASVEFSAENIPNEGSLDAKLIVTIGEKTKTFYIKINFKKKDSPDLTVSGKVGEPVDLGLSVKWASWNVGAGAPEEYGNHYAWGELEPKTDYSTSTYEFYNNGYTKYGSIDSKYELDEADDVARQKWGKDWRMPTFGELKELYEKCSFSQEVLNGIPVTKVTGPNGNYIYMPGPGNFTGQTLYFKDNVGSYWSRNLEDDSYAKDLDFFTGYRSLNGDTRCHGQSVRPVYVEAVSGKAGEPVDLGLTSGTLWASCNIGASSPEEFGAYFAWGETAPKSNYDWSTYKFGGGSNFTKYNSNDGLTELELQDDAAYVILGEGWRMPTHQQEIELANECSWESTTLNGVSGYKITGANGNSIFMPRGGLYDGTDYDADGTKVSYANTRGWYWSSTLNAAGSSYAQGLCFFPSLLLNVIDHERCDGHNIRPVYVGNVQQTESVKITDIGKTTYCSNYDLDFTNVQGIKAYIAIGYDDIDKTIWLARVMKVPAGTGLLLKGNAGTYKIPHANVRSTYVNYLKGNLGDAIKIEETDGDKTNYYLSGKDGTFVSVNGSANIGKNKAYLQLPTSVFGGTRSIGISYDDEDGTTSIKNLTPALSEGEGEWYTLQGQRVAKPGKGLYIRNGKKVVIK